MPFRHLHNASGIVLLAVAVIIAAIAGLSRRGATASSAVLTILAALLGIIIAFYLLRQL